MKHTQKVNRKFFRVLMAFLMMSSLTLMAWSPFSHPAGAINGDLAELIQAERKLTFNDFLRANARMQYIPREIAYRYPFLNLENNRLHFPRDSAAFEGLYKQLDSIFYHSKGSLSILHIGGSHVQAGIVGHQLREHLNDLAPGSVKSRGLLFPYKVAGTNGTVFTGSKAYGNWEAQRCAHSRHHARWGMSGMELSTQDDSASISLWATREDSSLYSGKVVRLYYNIGQTSMKVHWNGKAAVDSVVHDSTALYTSWYLREPCDTISFSFQQTDSLVSQISVKGFWLGDPGHGVVYNEIGVNGASTRSYLRCSDFHVQVNDLRPDLVIFGIGVNDAHVSSREFDVKKFKERYDSLIQPMRVANPEIQFLFLTNNDNHYRGSTNRNGKKVQQAMFELAEKYNAGVWDLYDVMGSFGAIDDWYHASLAKRDRVHFTRDGYRLQANLMYMAMMNDFSNWLEQHYLEDAHSELIAEPNNRPE